MKVILTHEITNLGSPGDPSIVIDSALFEGSGAGAFSEDLATPVTLTPGQSINVEVSFTPTSAGSFPAELVLNHDGVGSRLDEMGGTGLGEVADLVQ